MESTGNDTPLALKSKNFIDTTLTNTVGPILVAQHFMPYLEKSKTPVLMNMSSGRGSITNASAAYQLSYCASKAALNMFVSYAASFSL